ncbi:UNVERIFIED_CONTAM: Thermospermine synthase ACAULIS5 [Sesamum radiatum]|uniref:Thermospermine synthase ACAULIS5 n=1 Tax=Sesamum radiatum TaxID=300843 RepID=A0AAW2JRK8_SESRA
MGSEAVELFPSYDINGFSSKLEYYEKNKGHMMKMEEDDDDDSNWFEEEIDTDLKWSFALNRVVHKGRSEYQEIALLDTKRFGKEVVDFCTTHLTANHDAFRNPKLDLLINDAKAELERREEKFDIVVGDLADPVEGGPCYQLYTKSFYQNILKPKLNTNGIFVTQAGPAGVFTHKEVFSSIYNTIRQVFKYVRAYTAHVPSFADTWGWVIASDEPLCIEARKMDKKIAERIDGELLYLNGASFVASTILNKTVAKTLKNESHVYSEENARFIHGQGVAYRIH